MRSLWQRYSLGIVLCSLWLATSMIHAGFSYSEAVTDAEQHQVQFKPSDWAVRFGRETFENWQSEYLQLFSFVVLTKYLVFQGSKESKKPGTPPDETG